MDAIIEQIKPLAKDSDDITRKTIIDQLRDVCISLETAQDAMQRISYTVRLLSFDESLTFIWLGGLFSHTKLAPSINPCSRGL
jgi:hypothetical protein